MLADPAVLTVLSSGELTVTGQLIEASNVVLFGAVTSGEASLACVYKPVRGERPLWDFPDGTLAARETAAFLVSEALGWEIVPPTVLRDGPLGLGMAQAWVDVDESVDLIELLNSKDDERLRRLAVYDAVVNNADRKGGHILPAEDHLYGIDHGVCFNAEDKLRTVLWQWRGKPLPAGVDDDLRRLLDDMDGWLGEALAQLLTAVEVAAMRTRIQRLLTHGVFPRPSKDWPPVPWPPI